MGKYRKIYVLAPAGKATGGVELSHQLVDYLNRNGCEAYIVYVNGNSIIPQAEVPDVYRKYQISTSDFIEDAPDNMLILPEIYFDYIYRYRAIRIGCWWMSVDNHYYSACLGDMLRFYRRWKDKAFTLYRYLKGEIHFRNSLSDLRGQSDRIVHLYQSVYAQQHLYSIGMKTVLPLSDYINPELFAVRKVEKEDLVLFNPKKGGKYVDKLKKHLPGVQFIPLMGLSREELNALFDRAKVYVDFGAFPGKDRIPREAVIHGCCLITGRFGASAFYEDVPVPEKYKFEMEYAAPWGRISTLIRDVFDNYGKHFKAGDFMRERIMGEQETFYREAKALFL